MQPRTLMEKLFVLKALIEPKINESEKLLLEEILTDALALQDWSEEVSR